MTVILKVKFNTDIRSNTKKGDRIMYIYAYINSYINNILENVRGKSMVHPSILDTQAFKWKRKTSLKQLKESQHIFVMFAGSLGGKNVIK